MILICLDIVMRIGEAAPLQEGQYLDIVYFLGLRSFLGRQKNKRLFLVRRRKKNIEQWQ